jgi:hypothetical protein
VVAGTAAGVGFKHFRMPPVGELLTPRATDPHAGWADCGCGRASWIAVRALRPLRRPFVAVLKFLHEGDPDLLANPVIQRKDTTALGIGYPPDLAAYHTRTLRLAHGRDDERLKLKPPPTAALAAPVRNMVAHRRIIRGLSLLGTWTVRAPVTP